MQAILTRYIGPTNFRGTRVRASCAAGSIIVPWDDALGIDANHAAARRALVRKLDWQDRTWASGTLASGDFVHVITGRV